MSLVTLRSIQQDNGANVSQSVSNFTNHFKEAIVLGPGNTVELVSMSIVKLSKYEVISGSNDTMLWRIGAGPTSLGGTPIYSQHEVKLVAGSYNGNELASHIAEQLNNSTLLGVYKGTWTCAYTDSSSDDNATFSINYGQNLTPPENANELNWSQKYGVGNPYQLVKDGALLQQKLTFTQPLIKDVGPFYDGTTMDYGFNSDRGLFSNGGKQEIIIRPVEFLDTVDFAIPEDAEMLNLNNVAGSNIKVVITEPALPNGWNYQMAFFSGVVGYIYEFVIQGVLGEIETLHTFNGGSGYSVGDTGSFTGGSGTGATYSVTAVDGTGGVTAADIVNAGQGYLVNDDLTFSGNGDGLSTCKVLTITTGNDGTGYVVGDTGNLVYGPGGGTGTGATYRITSVGAGGTISGVEITDGGSGYSNNEVLLCDGNGNNDGKIRITLVDRQSFNKFGRIFPSGILGIGSNKNLQSNESASWDKGQFTPNGTTPAPAYHRWTQVVKGDGTPIDPLVDTAVELQTQSGGGFQMTLYTTYPKTIIGYSRQQLVNGDFNNANAVYTNGTDGLDVQCMFEVNNTNDKVLQNVYQLEKQAGRNYPTAGWRDTKIITEELDPEAWSGMPQNPSDWQTFAFGSDHIKLTMELDANRNIGFYTSHDSLGDNNFSEEALWLKTGDKVADSNGEMTNDFNTTIREILYPLHSIVFTGRGSPFTAMEYDLKGIYDTSVITQDMILRSSNGLPPTSVNAHDEIDLDVSVGASPLTLSAIYKMGLITGDDIYNGPNSGAGPNQISNRDLAPNIANSNLLLGLEPAYTFQAGQTDNAITTDKDSKPFQSLSEPALHVELPDFNIKSWSGQSSDTGRAIAVIPKEQWTTDESTGVLHYQAQYPIPIDLNLPHSRPFYELSARLRQPNGQLADDLINPTEICLKIGENEESRQSRVMMKAMERMGEIISNSQDRKISAMTDNNPML